MSLRDVSGKRYNKARFSGLFVAHQFSANIVSLEQDFCMTGKRFALYVTANPINRQGQLSALRFAEAAVAAGHTVARVFFAGEAVLIGNALLDTPSDEPQLQTRWRALTQSNASELLLCSAAAQRYGVMGTTAATVSERNGNLADGFTISGLGSLVECALDCDRVIHFPG